MDVEVPGEEIANDDDEQTNQDALHLENVYRLATNGLRTEFGISDAGEKSISANFN